MKKIYLNEAIEKFTANYDNKNLMERYYQQRKIRCLYNMIKTLIDESRLFPDKIIDIGAGEGVFLDITKKFNQNITTIGLDIAKKHCMIMKEKGHYSILADAENFPIKNNIFDVIFLLDVIEHFYDAKILDEINKSLRNDGILLLSTPNKYGIYEYKEWVYFGKHLKDIFNSLRKRPRSYFPYHVNLYSKKDIRKTLKIHGFSIESLNTIGFCLPFFGNLNIIFKIYKTRVFLKILDYFEKKVDFFNFLIVLRCRKNMNEHAHSGS